MLGILQSKTPRVFCVEAQWLLCRCHGGHRCQWSPPGARIHGLRGYPKRALDGVFFDGKSQTKMDDDWGLPPTSESSMNHHENPLRIAIFKDPLNLGIPHFQRHPLKKSWKNCQFDKKDEIPAEKWCIPPKMSILIGKHIQINHGILGYTMVYGIPHFRTTVRSGILALRMKCR